MQISNTQRRRLRVGYDFLLLRVRTKYLVQHGPPGSLGFPWYLHFAKVYRTHPLPSTRYCYSHHLDTTHPVLRARKVSLYHVDSTEVSLYIFSLRARPRVFDVIDKDYFFGILILLGIYIFRELYCRAGI